MKKIIAKNFYKILIFLIITNILIVNFSSTETNIKILSILISAILFFISYLFHEECMNEIGFKVLQIENIMKDEFNKKLSEKDIKEIYNKEYDKYFNRLKD